MNIQKYTSLLARPQDISHEEVKELDTILEAYPFFQSAHALRLKGLKIQNSFLYNEALKVTAAHTTDRDILFDYITSKTFAQDEISEHILQHSEAVKELPVVAENVSEAVSLEVDRQLKAEIKKAESILDPKLFERKEPPVPLPTSETEEAPPEKILKLNEPLEFHKEEKHSFSEWLKLTKAQPIDRETEPEKPAKKPIGEKEKKFQRIEKFIQDLPKLDPLQSPAASSKKNKNLAKPYTKPSDSLMTETLAKVYLQQKNYKKAIQAYKILILKNPEKSGFFADQIRAIEKLINKEQ